MVTETTRAQLAGEYNLYMMEKLYSPLASSSSEFVGRRRVTDLLHPEDLRPNEGRLRVGGYGWGRVVHLLRVQGACLTQALYDYSHGDVVWLHAYTHHLDNTGTGVGTLGVRE